MKRLTNLMHSLLCCKAHPSQLEKIRELRSDDRYCMFYLEQTFDEAWEMKDHADWEEQAKQFLTDFELKDANEAYQVLLIAVDLLRAAAPHMERYPLIKQLLIKLIEVS